MPGINLMRYKRINIQSVYDFIFQRFTHAAVELNGAIYAVGGCDGKDCLK